jgi:hypothetical protein
VPAVTEMVQAIENKADIVGDIVQIEAGAVTGTVEVSVRVAQVDPVQGYANMFGWALGQTIRVRVQQSDAGQLSSGWRIAARVRSIGPGAGMAEPGTLRTDPKP